MSWICISCGSTAKTSRRKCRKCGGMRWKPYPQQSHTEENLQIRQLNPKGLLLARPGKQSYSPDSKGIECGKCHTIVYSPEKEFDMTAFKMALRGHYIISPDCAD